MKVASVVATRNKVVRHIIRGENVVSCGTRVHRDKKRESKTGTIKHRGEQAWA